LNNEPRFRPAAVILAGGRSSRFAPTLKALVDLKGKAMIRHVIDRLRNQARTLVISVKEPDTELDKFGLPTVSDIVQRHRGPLTGLCSAMAQLAPSGSHEWIMLCPCDAPFVPRDLAERLYTGVASGDQPVSVARYDGVVQPTFSLWRLSLLPQISDAVMTQGRGGLMSMLDHVPHVTVDWPRTAVSPFFNINTRADLDAAVHHLDRGAVSD
jgi:molybdopterin-guanine dinucleotide biosynthesis protein A